LLKKQADPGEKRKKKISLPIERRKSRGPKGPSSQKKKQGKLLPRGKKKRDEKKLTLKAPREKATHGDKKEFHKK